MIDSRLTTTSVKAGVDQRVGAKIRVTYRVMAFALFAILVNGRGDAQEFDTPSFVTEQCAQCHAIGKSNNSLHPAAPPMKRIAGSHDLDRLYESFVTGTLIPGHPDMPLFKLDWASARAIIRYLREIQE